MRDKTTPQNNDPTKLNVPLVPVNGINFEDANARNCTTDQKSKTRRSVKLPRLKLADLVSQVNEENTHGEISTR